MTIPSIMHMDRDNNPFVDERDGNGHRKMLKMTKAVTTVILLSFLSIFMFTGCMDSASGAKPSLELVKFVSYDSGQAPNYVISDDGEEIPIADLYIRNAGDEPICWLTIGQIWLDKDGNEVSRTSYGFILNDVLLPGQTARIDASIPVEMNEHNRERIEGFSFDEYSYSTVSGQDVIGNFKNAPESLPITKAKTIEFAEYSPCEDSPIDGDITLLDEKKTLTVKSIKYDVNKEQVKIKLENQTEKRIDFTDEPTQPMVYIESLDADGNIFSDTTAAIITEDGVDPGQSITLKVDYTPGDDEKFFTVTGVSGFVYSPFHTIPKAVKVR